MVAAVGTDTLLFSDSTPGDDAIIVEKKRLVAALDLPRPEMIINIWSFQTSSTDEEGVEHATGRARNLVKTYNDVLQQAVDLGWEYMKERIDNPRDYFDEKFYGYVTGKFIADPSNSAPGPHPASATAQALLNRSTGTPMSELQRQQRGACKATQYCLGYSRVFQPLRPRLTDLLLAVIAANDPCSTSMVAIDRMEKRSSAGPDNCTVTIPVEASDCVETDLNAERENRPAPRLYIECFRIAATQEFSRIGSQPTPLGLLRSSIADFLFHYKRSIMYSHEFDPYELSQSAQALNTQLSPLIDAFNRDIATFQDAMSEVVRKPKLDPGPWAGADKATFVSNGWITVRSISGVDTIVNTTTQSFLDATQQPTISALLNSIEGVHPGTATPTGSTTPFPDLLQNLSPIQAQVLVGALSSVQTSKVQIGRSLNIDITPRSLAGASAAELTVKINADESAAPSYYTPQSNAPDISRVANHDTTTRVRVDSIKLFDVSTLTAQLQKSRARFPLLPPFVEIPYIGTFIGVPLPSAKEFHSSTVVLSTIIVPTAADIALGLSFDLDRFVDSNGASRCVWNTTGMPPGPKTVPCRLRAVQFLSDLQSDRISSYHKKMISCLAMNAGHPKYDLDGKPSMSTCGDLALENNGLEASE